MALTDRIVYVHEPTPLQCGQAVLAMLTGKTVREIVCETGTERETRLEDMFSVLAGNGIRFSRTRVPVAAKEDLPQVCILSLETPRCWHWSLYYKGTFYDPEHGILNDFPKSNRKYFWKIVSNGD